MDTYNEKIISMRSSQPEYWTVEPLVPGETIQRSYSITYAEAVRRLSPRQGPRDFSLVPSILDRLHERPLNDAREHARAVEHLRNAANESLPDDVRTQHYDIAGAIIYHANGPAHHAFILWHKGGGV